MSGNPQAGGTITVTAAYSSCPWVAVTLAPSWLTITSAAAGTGSGSVTYAVADNPGEPRVGGLTVAGKPFTVALAQGNIPQALKWKPETAEYTLITYYRQVAATRADLPSLSKRGLNSTTSTAWSLPLRQTGSINFSRVVNGTPSAPIGPS